MTEPEITQALNDGVSMEDIDTAMAQEEYEPENTSRFGFESQEDEDSYFDEFEKGCR